MMRVRFRDFNPRSFSFQRDPVLVLEEFWSPQEMARWQEAMGRANWRNLQDLSDVSKAFPDCGNWAKAQIAGEEVSLLMSRVALPCIADYVESFPNIKGRHVGFSYYSYSAGDSLSTHDDTDEAYAPPGTLRPSRRLALVSYFHSAWEPDWGGELLVYDRKREPDGKGKLQLTHCVLPEPGSVAMFTVPRPHRVARVDQLAGEHKRLSIAGWFMTEH
ncbi:MAG: 2OG-Fe(II) oxygenase [Nitrospirae bacterium]|nr:2OG-Fe(II) oxygenase [Nitrospirota bacterium]